MLFNSLQIAFKLFEIKNNRIRIEKRGSYLSNSIFIHNIKYSIIRANIPCRFDTSKFCEEDFFGGSSLPPVNFTIKKMKYFLVARYIVINNTYRQADIV